MNRLIIGLLILLGMNLGTFSGAEARSFRPFWDFRQWGEAGRPSNLYLSYMDQFSRQGVTALILIGRESQPPFPEVRRFLADAVQRRVKVWIRTNRVSPKRGIPGRPNSTLDFALDTTIQKDSLDYLLALAGLSKEYPNLAGLVIGGEELVGMKITPSVLERFSIAGSLTPEQKIKYFDRLQELQNSWYGKIWDTLRGGYPELELLIYPSHNAVCGGLLSRFPRPAYWDIHDLIVTRQKTYSVILPCYTVEDALGSHQTAAFGLYLRAATQDRVPYYLLLQVHRTEGSRHTPSREELQSHVVAAVESGASGVGYWPHDMDGGPQNDIYDTDRPRWQAVFRAIARGASHAPSPRQNQGLYVVKPRYSQYWRPDRQDTLRTLAGLRRAGLAPEFLLTEQILSQPLPAGAKLFYLPETFQYEPERVMRILLASGKPIFFGLGAAEPFTPEKKPLSPIYHLLGIQKRPHPENAPSPATQEVIATYEGIPYKLHLNSPGAFHRWHSPKTPARISFRSPVNGSSEDVPLVFTNGRLFFFPLSDYQFLLSGGGQNQNNEWMRIMIEYFSRGKTS